MLVHVLAQLLSVIELVETKYPARARADAPSETQWRYVHPEGAETP